MVHAAFRLPPIGGGEYPSDTNRLSGSKFQTGSSLPSNEANGHANPITATRPPAPIKKPATPALPKVKVLYDYNPQDLDELQLKEGDVVELLKER